MDFVCCREMLFEEIFFFVVGLFLGYIFLIIVSMLYIIIEIKFRRLLLVVLFRKYDILEILKIFGLLNI